MGKWAFYGIHFCSCFTDGDFAVLNFTVREWSYAAPGQADFYGCTVPDGEAVGRGLGEQLWALAAKYDLNS